MHKSQCRNTKQQIPSKTKSTVRDLNNSEKKEIANITLKTKKTMTRMINNMEEEIHKQLNSKRIQITN
jgi:hypothetical protein